jgi:hypothetical protein
MRAATSRIELDPCVERSSTILNRTGEANASSCRAFRTTYVDDRLAIRRQANLYFILFKIYNRKRANYEIETPAGSSGFLTPVRGAAIHRNRRIDA